MKSLCQIYYELIVGRMVSARLFSAYSNNGKLGIPGISIWPALVDDGSMKNEEKKIVLDSGVAIATVGDGKNITDPVEARNSNKIIKIKDHKVNSVSVYFSFTQDGKENRKKQKLTVKNGGVAKKGQLGHNSNKNMSVIRTGGYYFGKIYTDLQ